MMLVLSFEMPLVKKKWNPCKYLAIFLHLIPSLKGLASKDTQPAFDGVNKISTDKIKFHDRTDSLIFDANATTSFLQNCFMKRAIPLWNNIPKSISISKNKYFYETIKTKLKYFYNSQIKKEVEQPEHRMKCWKDYRFQYHIYTFK